MSQKVYSAMKIEFFPNQKRSGNPDLFRFLFNSYSTLKRYGYTGC